jgi:site-specific DNA-adenine methylase
MMLVMTQMRNNWKEFRDHYLRISEVFINTPQDCRKALYNCYKKRYAWNYQWLSEAELAANLLVMLKTNFNGIWQGYIMYGGRYSTPPGHINYKPTLFDITKVEEFRDMLCRATIYNRSFEDVPIPPNSWVFADPPYRDTKKMYSDQFTDELQSKLAAHLQSKTVFMQSPIKRSVTGSGLHTLQTHRYTSLITNILADTAVLSTQSQKCLSKTMASLLSKQHS